MSSVVVATGWKPYDAAKLDVLGYGKYPNVITNVVLERLAAAGGPTAGKITRPSDGQEIRSVAFVQCAGSRDENHLPYCSAVCCAASLKHATYIRSRYPDAKITIFYIDLRTPGQLELFSSAVREGAAIELIKGKVGAVAEDPATHELLVSAEDVLAGTKITRKYDLVVLATGIVPQTATLPLPLPKDEFGFISNSNHAIYAAGCAKRPSDVAAAIRDGTGAAMKAFQAVAVGASHG